MSFPSYPIVHRASERARTVLGVCALALAGAAADAQGDGGLDAALAEIRAERIRADLVFFADDAMRGRDTPSPEQRVAARFLRARLERLGFEPGAGDGYFHTYPLNERRIDRDASYVTIERDGATRRLTFGEDYFLYSSKHLIDVSLDAPALYCGEGDKSELEGLELAGRWAVCIDRGGSTARLVRNVERAGAAGLMVFASVDQESDPYPERFARATESALSGFVSPGPVRGRRAELPTIFLTRDAAAAVLTPAAPPALGADLGVTVHEERRGGGVIHVENVCGLWPGSDPERRDDVVIVSAHYDHVGARGDVVYNGADDNGSGSMGMLAVAEALRAYGPTKRSVMLMWVSGEEKGLWGSEAWTRDPKLPPGARPICDVNIDMIGRNAPEYLLLTPSPEHPANNGLARLVLALAPLEGFTEVGSADPWWRRSDHMNFAENLDIPVAFLFSDEHPDYHQPTDTVEKIDFDKIRRVARLVVRAIDAIDRMPSADQELR